MFKPSKEFKEFVNLKDNDKLDSAYKTTEVARILNLNQMTKELYLHMSLDFGNQFKQIKPKIFNSNRRYYDEKTINLLKVKFTQRSRYDNKREKNIK